MLLKIRAHRQLSLTLLFGFFTFQLFANSSFNGENNLLFTYQKNNVVFSTNDTLNTTSLILNERLYSKLVNNVSDVFNISLPIGFKYIDFVFEKHDFFDSNLKIISKTSSGDEKLDFEPEFISYKITFNKESSWCY